MYKTNRKKTRDLILKYYQFILPFIPPKFLNNQQEETNNNEETNT